ncbi:MFS transporter [Pantoea sp. Bo_2]|uniref:MFS transporter n=1 Tax=unclassified Pantoea TaxID=2630326 RepID=UPI001232635F|nr:MULTISPECIES: MFS transporter [unclassified Pantoea]KAA5945860.1 MFS transporter [Pantoea sp. VH_3]KAA5950111.1 MFS transporter [Pantoea sp. VH_24]KAA5953198.1 MFS transporter [Pantoea sp. VH_25]KAA5953903.1 MFS transporter [Pantoea sp. VH_16]KAA5959706.1 MFS transporter [Pantoea sp. VH_18]
MRSPAALALTGFSLIAVTYGMARFSWGLMLPSISADIPFSPQQAGLLSACSFVAYCLTILTAAALADRYGARLTALLAALSAASGLLLLACASSPLLLATGLFVAGLSSGLASPALAAAVSNRIAAADQPRINTLINAGTSAGIILTVVILSVLPGGWRAACLLFALLSLACLLPVMRVLSVHAAGRAARVSRGFPRLYGHAMRRLMGIALVSGLVSAAWWSFGSALLRQHVGVDAETARLLWLVAGGAGIVGAATGPVAARIGLNAVYRLSLCGMALPLLVLAFSHGESAGLLIAVACCGAGYVTLSGVLLVWGAQATAEEPATGVGILFFMLAVGQVAGSLLFGQLYAALGAITALALFALSALILLFITPSQNSDASDE